MSTFRIRMEFDIEIHDDAQGRALAAASMNRRVRQSEARGHTAVTSRGESPEVAVHGAAQGMRAAAMMLALEILRRGAVTLPWVTITDVDVTDEPPGP
jgi:hypothetical protein